MNRTPLWPRIALASSAIALSALACDSVLDIEEPKPKPPETNAGAAGEPNDTGNGGTSSTGGTTPQGGTATNGGAFAGEGGMLAGGDGPGNAAGDGGAGGGLAQECEPKQLRCDGDASKTPQVCDDSGHWAQNTDEAEADCPVLCSSGRCVECLEDAKRCSVCAEGDAGCNPNRPQKCADGAWKNDGAVCDSRCDGGGCIAAVSCDPGTKTETTCGTESCCMSLAVPGGTFRRDFDGGEFADDSSSATLRPFFLDKYEVTVGRMRHFVSAYNEIRATLFKDGWGKSDYLDEQGWNTGTPVPSDRDELIAQLRCDERATWSDSGNDDLPINCVSFPVAYAFCIWDGGRLPTEAEWNFAAAGGSEQRAYPWATGTDDDGSTSDKANYGTTGPVVVGSKPVGAGRWGHVDLAGNVAEWTLDYYYASYPEECNDCVSTIPASERAYRGGSYASDELAVLVANRDSLPASAIRPFIGFRCAHELR